MANTDPRNRFVLDPGEITKPEDNPSVAELRALTDKQAQKLASIERTRPC